jgi:hypothetical protein
VRFTKAQKSAVSEALRRGAEAADFDTWVDLVCHAFATARDEETVYAVLTDAGHLYGPYASAATARKALNSGRMLGTQGRVLGMRPVPRSSRKDPLSPS